jgi:hypothetical protein
MISALIAHGYKQVYNVTYKWAYNITYKITSKNNCR